MALNVPHIPTATGRYKRPKWRPWSDADEKVLRTLPIPVQAKLERLWKWKARLSGFFGTKEPTQ